MRAVGYIRMSDVSQIAGHSLDAQGRLFYELCRYRGWEAAGVYLEEGPQPGADARRRRRR